jgi:hypothetical protein
MGEPKRMHNLMEKTFEANQEKKTLGDQTIVHLHLSLKPTQDLKHT